MTEFRGLGSVLRPDVNIVIVSGGGRVVFYWAEMLEECEKLQSNGAHGESGRVSVEVALLWRKSFVDDFLRKLWKIIIWKLSL